MYFSLFTIIRNLCHKKLMSKRQNSSATEMSYIIQATVTASESDIRHLISLIGGLLPSCLIMYSKEAEESWKYSGAG